MLTDSRPLTSDGNFHGLLIFKEGDEAQFKQVEDLVHRMIIHAQDLGGTCSGEHGIGIGKKWAIENEVSTTSVQASSECGKVLMPSPFLLLSLAKARWTSYDNSSGHWTASP